MLDASNEGRSVKGCTYVISLSVYAAFPAFLAKVVAGINSQ